VIGKDGTPVRKGFLADAGDVDAAVKTLTDR
jgi:hypothetical protein